MYRIQAHNLNTKHIEIYKIMSWEYPDLVAKLKQSGSYGLIEAEYIARF
jgi:hypothetical protein